jgi:hypothetical protein
MIAVVKMTLHQDKKAQLGAFYFSIGLNSLYAFSGDKTILPSFKDS